MNNEKANFTVNNFPVYEYQDGELYIQTDGRYTGHSGTQLGVNDGRVYLRIVDLENMLQFLKDLKCQHDPILDGRGTLVCLKCGENL